MSHAFYVETPQSYLHDAVQEVHPENADRLVRIRSGLQAENLFNKGLTEISDIDQGKLLAHDNQELYLELGETHEQRYLKKLARACLLASKTHEQNIDTDTYVTRSTLEVIAGSIVAVKAATTATMNENSTAFCAIRPPGHHAGRRFFGGFCHVNSAAYAANLALRKGAKKVAIIDWDAHYGNGTQSIFNRNPNVFYLSLHSEGQFPRGGEPADRGEGAGKGFSRSVVLKEQTGDAEYLQKFTAGIQAVTEQIVPDFIVISAGFDAHTSDPLGNLSLTSELFGTVTSIVRETWNRTPIVSVLEGGYNPQALRESSTAHVKALLA